MMSSNIYIYDFRADSQRDEALQNLLESQETLEDYQKKTQERIRKVRTKVNEYLHMKQTNMVDPPPPSYQARFQMQ